MGGKLGKMEPGACRPSHCHGHDVGALMMSGDLCVTWGGQSKPTYFVAGIGFTWCKGEGLSILHVLQFV